MDEENTTKIGSGALQNIKSILNESSVFKVPKVPVQKRLTDKSKKKVLKEDAYVKSIAKIIQRDFFPDLEKLKAQNDFLEAQENKDYARLREITAKYSGHRPPTEPYNSPATFDTPNVDRPYSPAAPTTTKEQRADKAVSVDEDKPKDVTDNHSLDSFLSSYTTEDNVSYERLIALENKKRSTKLTQQLLAEQTSAALVDAALALPSIEQQANQTERPHELSTWRYRAYNHIMFVPPGAASQRPGAKPELQHRATRLRRDPFDQAKNKETINAIARIQGACVSGKIGVDGVSVTAEGGGAAAGAGAGAAGGARDYQLVATPSPRPGGAGDGSPLMTWGEIEGTPFRLDGGDTPLPALGAGAAYRMLEAGARERLALQLAERAARRRRTPAPPARTPTPGFKSNTERLASMSPAARKLATKHLLSPRLRLTPRDVGVLSHAAARAPSPRAARPPAAPTQPDDQPANHNNNLTDNLLQINVAKRSRLKAQDFFE